MGRIFVLALMGVFALGCGEGSKPIPTGGTAGGGTAGGGTAGGGTANGGTAKGHAAAPKPAGEAGGAPLRATSNAGSFVAVVTPVPATIPMNEHFGVELALFRADGTTPYEPEAVTLDARMEEHEHGMLRDVVLAPIGPGRWRADGLLFHMVGVWQFQVDVREGPRIERAQMDFLLQ
jgi:hypothetical protein